MVYGGGNGRPGSSGFSSTVARGEGEETVETFTGARTTRTRVIEKYKSELTKIVTNISSYSL